MMTRRLCTWGFSGAGRKLGVEGGGLDRQALRSPSRGGAWESIGLQSVVISSLRAGSLPGKRVICDLNVSVLSSRFVGNPLFGVGYLQ